MKRRAKITIKPNLNIPAAPVKVVEKEPEEEIEVPKEEEVKEPIEEVVEKVKETEPVNEFTFQAIEENVLSSPSIINVSTKDFPIEVPSRDSRAPSVSSLLSTSSEERRKRRKAFTGKEELDPTKFTMMDLIYWNPKTEKGLDKEKFKLPKSSTIAPRPKLVKKDEDNLGPRVKVDEYGNLVIDEESLVVKQQAESNIWETVDESTLPRKITSLSFRKNKVIRRSYAWTPEETDLFYEILQATGPDFTLMHQFFPTKARAELKAKYNREEKVNGMKLTHALDSPAMMDDIFFEKCLKTAEQLQKIKDEIQEEKERKAKELAEAREARKEAKLAKLREFEEAQKNANSGTDNDIDVKPALPPIRKISKSYGTRLKKRRIVEDSD
uniref:Myb_DNA-bind_7 domain-containing protein n=1 Tax=Strongyloides papillosus TaxID=174720 RepID=A0A0N5CCC5_STREA